MLRIIAGTYRSRILASPPDADVSRPYTRRVRESVFNLLRGWFEDATVLDLFAGVGSMGLEAVSRGATTVVLVEQDRQIRALLERNIATLGCGDRARAVAADALGHAVLLSAPRPVDVVFLDPPYRMMQDDGLRAQVLAQAERCVEVMAKPGFLVLRSPMGPDHIDLAVPGLDGPEVHRHGKDMFVLLYAPREGTEGLRD